MCYSKTNEVFCEVNYANRNNDLLANRINAILIISMRNIDLVIHAKIEGAWWSKCESWKHHKCINEFFSDFFAQNANLAIFNFFFNHKIILEQSVYHYKIICPRVHKNDNKFLHKYYIKTSGMNDWCWEGSSCPQECETMCKKQDQITTKLRWWDDTCYFLFPPSISHSSKPTQHTT